MLSAKLAVYWGIQDEAVPQSEFAFMNYVAEHGLRYATTDEYKFRLGIFQQNLEKVEAWNANPNKTSTLEMNKYAIWTEEELKSLTGYKAELNPEEMYAEDLPTDDLPASIDWVTQGAVTDVKDQGQCGSCWAFSTTGSIEGRHQIATGDLISLSEQQLVDCSWLNHGCNGGSMALAMMYTKSKGLELESDYPYTGTSGLFQRCKFEADLGKVHALDHTSVSHTVDQLKAAVA